MVVGYLKWKENCFFRSFGTEFKQGDLTEIYSIDHHRIQAYVSSGDCDILDKDKKPVTWQKLCDSQPPQQERVIVNKVKASTRPVKISRKK